MSRDRTRSVLRCSAENPDATSLTAGLPRGCDPRLDPITLLNIDLPIIAPEVTPTLAERGVTFGHRRPRVADRDKATAVAIGITLCVPPRET